MFTKLAARVHQTACTCLVGSEMCIRDSRYTVSTRMTPALRWAAMKAILMFYQVVEVLLYVHKNRRLIRDGQLDFHTAPEL